ncbi:MAG: uptB [Herminiimonas sp.]|nr:uptB [Herminiimonas sp.]MDB5853790.1 uptB [Herminiimonas sp.]
MSVTLHGYWRSLATFRVRAALNLKGIAFTEKIVDLSTGEQFSPEFHALNPQHVLPLLEHDALRLTQSLAIVEYLDESFPGQSLLPKDAAGRARVRALSQITAADVHPLIVPRVRNYLGSEFSIEEEGRMKWARHWLEVGTEAIEARLAGDGQSGQFAHGDQLTMADLALVSHVVGARLFKVALDRAPTLEAIANRCLAMPAIASAHPLRQPGAPAA